MKQLFDLLHHIESHGMISDMSIRDVTNHSQKVQPGDLYIAVKGVQTDGHRYAEDALKKGAAAVVVERDLGLEHQIIVPDTHKAYAQICANYFDNPSKKLKLIGITGTNGKTSVTTMIKSILESSNMKTGLIGTIQIEYGDVVKENPNTTPDAYLFHQTLSDMLEAGCKYVVMEASSHALAQERLYGCFFEVCAFTNLTQDHLDYHKDMEDYFQAKKKLFSMGKIHVVNVHDPYGKRLAEELGDDVVTFGIDDTKADFFASDIVCEPNAVNFRIHHDDIASKVHFAIPGLYSVENAMTAIAVCSQLGFSIDTMVTALGKMKGVKGRSEIIYHNDKFTVIRDYAHSPDGIENIMSSLKSCVNGRLVGLFGCGGDRDRTKRPLMAKACEKYADFMIITSDNPRTEDPDAIIEDILPGLSQSAKYITITQRKEAILYALTHAQQGDTIVLLGKGHETYQVLKDKTIHFDEQEVVLEIMNVQHKIGNEG